jgi:hypothetical protein
MATKTGTYLFSMRARAYDWDLFYTGLSDDDGYVDLLEVYCGGQVVYVLDDPSFAYRPERNPDQTVDVAFCCRRVTQHIMDDARKSAWDGR